MDENRDWQNTGTTSTEPANSSSTNNSVPVEETPTIETDTATADGEATQIRDTGFRPLTRSERRNLWLKEYGEQDFALQMWVRLVEQQDVHSYTLTTARRFRADSHPVRRFAGGRFRLRA